MGVSVKAEPQFITHSLYKCCSLAIEMVILFSLLILFINFFINVGKSFMATLDATLSKTNLIIEIPLKR